MYFPVPRVTDPDDVFHGCLADDQGLPLTKDGQHAFCFSALPQHQRVIQQRNNSLDTQNTISKQQKTLLQRFSALAQHQRNSGLEAQDNIHKQHKSRIFRNFNKQKTLWYKESRIQSKTKKL